MRQGGRPCVLSRDPQREDTVGLCPLEPLGRAMLIKHNINNVTVLRPVAITNKHLKITCLEHFYLTAFINNYLIFILYNNPGRQRFYPQFRGKGTASTVRKQIHSVSSHGKT